MEPLVASRTALATSLMRALHTRGDPAPIISDPWGDLLVPAPVREAVQRALSAASAMQGAPAEAAAQSIVDAWLRSHPAYATVITRSRYSEDALHAAVARGVRQYVLIGAGFDSYAMRTPAEAEHVEIFEIDHPATHSLKQQRIKACGISIRNSVHFLAADLANESLDVVLSRSAFKSAEPAFFSWLGVTMYLTREANLATLRAIARCAAPGSELVFTYIDRAAFLYALETPSGSFSELKRSVAAIGEPFVSGFDPKALAQDLIGVGLELTEDLVDSDVVARYDPRGVNKLRPATHSHIARASVRDSMTDRPHGGVPASVLS